MNMHTQPQRTPAETALIDAFGERLSLLPGDGAVMLQRDDAIEAIKEGLPTRRVEAWHYTDLRALVRTVPPLAGEAPSDPAELVALVHPRFGSLARYAKAPPGAAGRGCCGGLSRRSCAAATR